MSDVKTTNSELDEAIRLQKEATAKVEELKKKSRAEDLKTVKAMIELHGFTHTELKSALKTRAVKKDGEKRKYTKKAKVEAK